jgi:hypothetical protein
MVSIPDKASTADRQDSPVSLRSGEFKSRRKRGPGLLAAGVLGAGLAALVISSLYDERSVGKRLDAAVATTKSGVQSQVRDLRVAASSAAQDTAQAADKVAATLGDVGITAAVKTSLAADPTLSALKIGVKTDHGVVRLDGPAPSVKARERAQVLALAPSGVRQVDNQLVVTQRVPATPPTVAPPVSSTPAAVTEAQPPAAAPLAPPSVPDKAPEPVSEKPVDSKEPQPQ